MTVDCWLQEASLNSQFPVPNSQFPIPNSQFPIPSSQFPILTRNRYEYDTFVTVRKSSVVTSTNRVAINLVVT
ncbi:MAG: hypothetical protein F6K31_19695 [Symploca sp. SIO2G7]|nr:hypothetical protein [Symploca sp. SIO2G7]